MILYQQPEQNKEKEKVGQKEGREGGSFEGKEGVREGGNKKIPRQESYKNTPVVGKSTIIKLFLNDKFYNQ